MKKKDLPGNRNLISETFSDFGLSRRQFVKTGAVAAAGITMVPGQILSGAPVGTEFFVAVKGQDGNPGSKTKPFATLTKARDEVRKLIAKGLTSNVTVWIGGGLYTLTETLVLGIEDSGNDKYSVTWAGIPGEEPIISSGIKIEGWKELEETPVELPAPARGKVWVADVPESLGRFYTLYDKQGHLQRAQADGFIPEEPPAGVDRKDREISLRNMYYPEGVIKNWENIDDVEIVIRPSVRWTMNILALESVDESTRMARTKLPATYGLRRIGKERYKTVWVENVMEALHEPGNWVLNTHTYKLYLWPRTDSPVDIRAPKLSELIRVVERVLQKMGDGAAINVTGAGRGNYIKHNYCHDIFASEWVSGVLRTDDFQDGTTWENNIIYRANCGAWEHKGNNNAINNFAIDVLPRGYFRIFRDSINGSVIQHNIFYSSKGEVIFYTYAIGPEQLTKTKLDYNLYYCAGVNQTGTPKFLETVKAQGVGKNDIYADPMFEDLKPWNFKLKPNSPALKMGIKQIDLTGVGLTKDFPKQLMG